ncbi:hypothetical protein D5086_009210 [Populus alba]|uniref:Uncharacterized protein n=1 Tax=Populus alba TaxID=43335 RepID=A0ACC4CK14_POPAL
MGFHFTPLLLTLLLFSTLHSRSSSQTFKCSTPTTCHSLIDYISPNTTTFSHIKTLFSVKNIHSILAANNLPLSTLPNSTIPANQPIKISFPCMCINNTGHSNKQPIYTVQKDDGLSHIATEVFSGLVTYQEIAAVNNIPDVNLIKVGQKLWIPLPCNCDDVDGVKVVHYGHVVEAGSSLELIAQAYGTSTDTLVKLNGVNDSSLLAGQVLDVPLQACNSSVRSDSVDYPLLVPNNTYFFTANNCVKCKCDAANNWTLQCEASGIKPSNWSTCPAMQCEGGLLSIDNSTTSGCNVTTCAYAGFIKNQSIFTTLATRSACPVTAEVDYLILKFIEIINSLEMASTGQFSGKSLYRGLTSRSSGEQSRLTKGKRKFCLLNQSKVAKGLGGGDIVSRKCHLCAEQKNSLSPLVIRHRKARFGVVCCQSSSGYGVESTDEQERLVLEENKRGIINGSRGEERESIGVLINQPCSSDVRCELIMLSLPAIAGQAIDPFSQLMETAYIGRLGPVELGSAGVSIMIFNNVSKLFNIPLLSVATSFVAEDIAKNATKDSISENGIQEDSTNGKPIGMVERKQLSSVSTALILAIGIGIFEALALSLGCGSFLNLMGITMDSPMRIPAERFLSLRALGAPAVVVSLALQGIFRGFKDTKTPVFCLGLGNLSAIFLFPILMYYLKLGVTGAAISTVVSQYLVTFLMVWHLNKRVILLPPKVGGLQFGVYMKSGGFLIGRTLAVLTTMTLATSMAARQGAVAMAAHQICMQIWLAVSLLTDALASSGQALIASYSSEGDHKTVKEVTKFVLKIGLVVGVSLAAILGVSFGSIATLFTKDADVLGIVRTGILFVSASQPINALAFIFDGLHYGVSDFPYAAKSMMLVGLISSAFLLYAPIKGLPGVWSGLALFMGLRTAAGCLRLVEQYLV